MSVPHVISSVASGNAIASERIRSRFLAKVFAVAATVSVSRPAVLATLDVSQHVRGAYRRDRADRRAVVRDCIARRVVAASWQQLEVPGSRRPSAVHPLDQFLAGIAAFGEADGHVVEPRLGWYRLAGY